MIQKFHSDPMFPDYCIEEKAIAVDKTLYHTPDYFCDNDTKGRACMRPASGVLA